MEDKSTEDQINNKIESQKQDAVIEETSEQEPLDQAAQNLEESEQDIPTVKFMIVTIQNKQYALLSQDVQEIVQNEKIHELPFVPSYIEGVINCRGTPYTVLNPLILFEEQQSNFEGKQFLIIRRDDDQFCLRITTAETLISVPETEAQNKTVMWQDKEIMHINCDEIEKILQKDLEQ